jgi:hypothetical protein
MRAALFLILLPGCVAARLEHVVPGDYQLVESGHLKTFRVVAVVESHSRVIPAAARFDVVLVEDRLRPDDHGRAMAFRDDAPPGRRLDRIAHVVNSFPRDVPTDRPRWLLSTDPLVIAIGVEAVAAPDWYRAPYLPANAPRLIAPPDRERRADRLIRIENWPPPIDPATGLERPIPPPALVSVPLPKPRPLADLLVTQP